LLSTARHPGFRTPKSQVRSSRPFLTPQCLPHRGPYCAITSDASKLRSSAAYDFVGRPGRRAHAKNNHEQRPLSFCSRIRDRCSGKIASVQPETIAHSMRRASDGKLGKHSFAFDPPHVFTAVGTHRHRQIVTVPASSGHNFFRRRPSKLSMPVGESIFARAAIGATSKAQYDMAAISVAIIFETLIGEGDSSESAFGAKT
jgi:hypothetical protein